MIEEYAMQQQMATHVKRSLAKRKQQEQRFRLLGVSAIVLTLFFLAILLCDMLIKALPAAEQNYLQLTLKVQPEMLVQKQYRKILYSNLYKIIPNIDTHKKKRSLKKILSKGAIYQVKEALKNMSSTELKIELLLTDKANLYLNNLENNKKTVTRLNTYQQEILDKLVAKKQIVRHFNWQFFTNSDSREPELAGIKGALVGTLLTIFVTLLIAFPIGVGAALYLEEFAANNKFSDFIEININNLASVPSIVFGLLGLAVFINCWHLPRSAPLVGGLVLALMTLPTIIIASRAAIKTVPATLKEAALGLGASKMQVAFNHTLVYAMPGVLTGTIIGIAQAIGETAPLLMIGMVAFIVDIPSSILDSATALPVQIFLWSDSPERGFMAKTSAAIVVLLAILILINASAIYLRKKFEQKG